MKYVLPNTVLYAIVVGVGGYALSFLMAWILAQVTPRARTLYALAMYTPSMVGQLMIQVIWKTIFSGDQTGLANAYLQKLGLINQPIQWLISSDYFMQIMIFTQNPIMAMSCQKLTLIVWQPEPAILLIH